MEAVVEDLARGDQGFITPDDCPFRIELDTGTNNQFKLIMFESWLEIWCKRFCTGHWIVAQETDPTRDYQIVLKFSDPREAVHFKLSAEGMHVRPLTPSYTVN